MGTHHKGSSSEVRALDAFIKLTRASESVNARLNAELAREDLTVSQFGALETLFHLGPLCQKDIAHKLLKSGGNITLVVDNLQKRGLVERSRDGKDRRFVTVRLTDAGRALIEGVFPSHMARIVELMKALSADEQEALGRLCKRLGIAVSETAADGEK
jgi:MarR family 2-MHQ and catechol resistance regulon transcriptional repressor